MVRGTAAVLATACTALALAACGGDGPVLPGGTRHVEVESVTEVVLDGDGAAELTFSSEENFEYLVYAVGGTATFEDTGDVEAGVEATWYSVPESEAVIEVRGEPGATVLVSLQLIGGEEVRLGGSTTGELVVGDCATHWLHTAGVDELVAVLTGDLDRLTHEQGYLYGDETGLEQRTDADGNPVFTTAGSDGFSYRVCNTSGETARYELSTAEYLEPGQTPAPLPTVDGQATLTGSVPAGEVRVHRVFVPAGYEALVLVEPGAATPPFDVELYSFSAGGGYGHHTSHIPGEAEFVEHRGDEPAGDTVLVVVRHSPRSPAPPVGTYTITVS